MIEIEMSTFVWSLMGSFGLGMFVGFMALAMSIARDRNIGNMP